MDKLFILPYLLFLIWDIEYECDYFYSPKEESPYTFLGYTISGASFYLTENQKIKSFGFLIEVDDSYGFYRTMVKTYGDASVVSPSKYFFEKRGFVLPTKKMKRLQK